MRLGLGLGRLILVSQLPLPLSSPTLYIFINLFSPSRSSKMQSMLEKWYPHNLDQGRAESETGKRSEFEIEFLHKRFKILDQAKSKVKLRSALFRVDSLSICKNNQAYTKFCRHIILSLNFFSFQVTPPSLTTDIEPEELSTALPTETSVEDIIRPQTTPFETRATQASIVIVDDRGNPLRKNEDGQIVRDDGTVIPTDTSGRPVGQDGSPLPTDSQNRYVLISEVQTTPSAIATDDTGRKIYPVIRPGRTHEQLYC